jgi:Tfp pilus assembly protein PilX
MMKTRTTLNYSNQKGAILITLIVSIVIISITYVGMQQFSTTSTYGEILANRQERAYYMAEAGINYARYLFNPNPTLPGSNYTNGPFPIAKTFTLSNGQFTIKTSDKPGDPTRLLIESTGIVESGWLTTRQLVTKEISKVEVNGSTTTPDGDLIGFDSNSNSVLDTSWTVTAGTNVDIVSTGPSGGPALQFKGDTAAIDLKPTYIDLWAAWKNNDDLLGYFLQVKINVNSEGNKGDNYLLGLSFRKIDNNNFYGLSFYRSEGLHPPGGLPSWCTPSFTSIIPNDGKVYAVLWKNSSGIKTVMAYALMDYATYGVVTDVSNQTLAAWSSLFIRVNEKKDGPGGARRNHLKAYVIGPASYPLGTTNWNFANLKQITWTVAPALNPAQSAPIKDVLENSITSADFTTSRPEIGVHAHYDSNAANDQFFNGFSTVIQGMGGSGEQW